MHAAVTPGVPICWPNKSTGDRGDRIYVYTRTIHCNEVPRCVRVLNRTVITVILYVSNTNKRNVDDNMQKKVKKAVHDPITAEMMMTTMMAKWYCTVYKPWMYLPIAPMQTIALQTGSECGCDIVHL